VLSQVRRDETAPNLGHPFSCLVRSDWVGFVVSHPVDRNHPTDEDLSAGAPVNRQDGARRVRGGGRIELGVAMYYSQRYGEVAERFKAAVLKTAEPLRVP
jgi:hypothetical protein